MLFILSFRYDLLFILSFHYDFLLFHYVMRGNGLQQPVNSIAGCLNHSLGRPDTSGLLKSLALMGQIHRDCWVSWVSDVFFSFL